MSELRALLLTDVVDSTKLSERLGDAAMAEVWAAHDRVARDLLPECRGREIDKTDGMLLLFESASDAVHYARSYHRALAALPVPLKARAGLHVGPVILRQNSAADVARGAKPLEVDGLAKPTAARVMSIAQGGQILMTPEAREAIAATDLQIVSHGHWVLKGLAEPIELFEAGDAETVFAAPPDGEKAHRVIRSGERWLPVQEIPNNLPQQTTSFIGRERELDDIKSLLTKVRLLTLLGMGGLGKTRLSLQVAAEVIAAYPDGAWFLDLAPIRDAALVTSEAAQVLGVREEPDRPLVQTLCAYLKPRRLLIVFDNCEHLIKASADLAAAILRAAPQVRLLASSRESLHVPGEQSYPILPLPVPRRDDSLEVLSRSTAVRLFVERAQSHKPAFALNEREAPAVADLVARLEGIPLALELAAARVRSLSVADINARLKDRYKILTGGARVLQQRQQTLRALVDWSYELLSEAEQTVLNRLAVFAGGFDLAAAEAVCGTDPLLPEDLLDLLGSLVEKSLVMLDETGVEPRYRMLETIRDYAAEKLQGSGESSAIAAQHCQHYFVMAKDANRGMSGPEQAQWIERMELEHDNVRAATRLALAGGVDPVVAVKLCVALQGFWTLRGYATEGRDLVRAALALPAVQDSDMAQAHALYVGAALAEVQSDHAEARRMLETCLALRRILGNPVDVAATLSTLTYACLKVGDVEGAASGEREALEIFRSLDDRIGEGIGLLHLGQIGLYTGADDEAKANLERGLALSRQVGYQELEAECERTLGELDFEAGRPDAAAARFTRSLDVCREVGDRQGEANALCWLGRIALQHGDVDSARHQLGEALKAFRDFDMREELLGCLEEHARLAWIAGLAADGWRIAAAVSASRERLGLTQSPRAEGRWRATIAALGAAVGAAGSGAGQQADDEAIGIDDAARAALELKIVTTDWLSAGVGASLHPPQPGRAASAHSSQARGSPG